MLCRRNTDILCANCAISRIHTLGFTLPTYIWYTEYIIHTHHKIFGRLWKTHVYILFLCGKSRLLIIKVCFLSIMSLCVATWQQNNFIRYTATGSSWKALSPFIQYSTHSSFGHNLFRMHGDQWICFVQWFDTTLGCSLYALWSLPVVLSAEKASTTGAQCST